MTLKVKTNRMATVSEMLLKKNNNMQEKCNSRKKYSLFCFNILLKPVGFNKQ